MKYFEEKVHAGEWDEVEKYLSGFTKVDDNRYSMKIFFEIRKQKYLEALDKYVHTVTLQCHSFISAVGSDLNFFFSSVWHVVISGKTRQRQLRFL